MFVWSCLGKSRAYKEVRIEQGQVNKHRYGSFPHAIDMKKSSNLFHQVFGFTSQAETCNGRLAMFDNNSVGCLVP
ncbi:hypothetical protein Gasu2_12250 [Galdieria sulphuraria]|nr:hypothetical protein Gasu2_12250 [Galdieria sulphuraria]